jgi:estrone sulfotransferase
MYYYLRKTYYKFRRLLGKSLARRWVPDPLYPDDTFVVSYPRSGNTWMLFILTHLKLKSDTPVDFKLVQETIPDIHMVDRYGISLDVPRPRIIKSHASFAKDYPKVVYLVRDGRDVAVSFYHYQQKFSRFDGTLYNFIKYDFNYYIPWSDHIISWLFREHKIPILCVRYEDMLTDGLAQIRRLCGFLGLESTDEEINRVLELTKFNKMRKIEENQGLGYMGDGKEGQRFIRKGKSGDWKVYFDQKTKELFKSKYQFVLERMGYVEDENW